VSCLTFQSCYISWWLSGVVMRGCKRQKNGVLCLSVCLSTDLCHWACPSCSRRQCCQMHHAVEGPLLPQAWVHVDFLTPALSCLPALLYSSCSTRTREWQILGLCSTVHCSHSGCHSSCQAMPCCA
jgi:hypothetical protein